MMQNMAHPQEQLPIDEITSNLGAQIFEFCQSELFPETFRNSEVVSSSNNCSYEDRSSRKPSLSITVDMNRYNILTSDNAAVKSPAIVTPTSGAASCTTTGPSTPTAAASRNTSLVTFIEDQINENDLSAAIDFSGPSQISFSTPNHNHHQRFNNNSQERFSMNNQISQEAADGGSIYNTAHQYNPERGKMVAAVPLIADYEEEYLPSSVPSYIRLRNSSSAACALVDPVIGPYLSGAPISADNSGIFTGNLFLGNDFNTHQELEFQGDNGGFFIPDSMARLFNCSGGDLQALSSESQLLLHSSPSATLTSDISSLEDPTFKVGKLSPEERKRKIHRYLKKRNERNFSKKIKYACRKTLADSRPRVRGRFAKNEGLGESARNANANHEDDTDEDISLFSNTMPSNQHKVVKDEGKLDPSDVFAHLSGVNSFKCSYPIQSWI